MVMIGLYIGLYQPRDITCAGPT